MTTEREWFTVAEAADYLRVSRRTIYKLVHDGRLLAHRLGETRHIRFRRADLDLALRPMTPIDTETTEENDRAA